MTSRASTEGVSAPQARDRELLGPSVHTLTTTFQELCARLDCHVYEERQYGTGEFAGMRRPPCHDIKQPVLLEQQTFLTNLLVSNPTPQQFEHMIVSCDAYGAKKTQRFVVQLHINRNTPLTHIYMYVKWAIGTLGGALQCGQGPRGEAVRQVTGA